MYLSHIDGLRALAVLAVMLTHYALPIGTGGFLGVDVFFVISGFLITRLIAREQAEARFSFRRFYLRRIRRLMPAALSVVALTLLFFLPILSAKDLADLLKATPASILPAANLYYFSTVGYFDTDALSRPLLHYWSLAVEEQFYFIWPALLLFVLARFPRTITPVTLALLLLSVLSAELVRRTDFNASYYLLPFRAFELMVGAQLALAMRQKMSAAHFTSRPGAKDRAKAAIAGLGLLTLLISFGLFDKSAPFPGLWSLLPCLGAALLIRYGGFGPVGRLLTHPAMIWIGKISYSLYLVHWPIYVYFSYRLPETPTLALKIAFFPLAIAIGAANYYLVENKWRRPAPAAARFGNWPALAGIAATAILLVIPTFIKYKDRSFGIRSQDANIQQPAAFARKSERPWPGLPADRTIRVYQSRTVPADGPRVLLLGDSHAGHLETGLVHLLTPKGITLEVATLPGCPPLFGAARYFDLPGRTREQALCAQASRGAKAGLALSAEYDAVILAARWFNMVEPGTFGDQRNRQDLILSPDALTPYQATQMRKTEQALRQARNFFAQRLDATLRRLSDAGKKVVVFSQVPGPGNNLSQCLHLFPWAQNGADLPATSRCAQFSRQEKLARAKFTDDLIRDTGARHGALAVIPADLFCATADSPCFRVDYDDEWNLMFRDSNHLSRKGSLDLAQTADRVLGLTGFLFGHQPPGTESLAANISR